MRMYQLERHGAWPNCAARLRAWLLGSLVLFACGAVNAADGIHPSYLSDADAKAIAALLDGGADVNAKHIGGATALHHLVSVSAEMGTSGQRIRKGKIYFAGQWGATGHKQIAEMLLAAGADVNATDSLGQTPLHVAALTGHSEACRFLLTNGAEVNAADNKQRTPLAIAIWTMSDEAMAELEAATGRKPNTASIRRRASAVISLLKAYGATE